MREMPLAEVQAIHEELLRQHDDAVARWKDLSELYPGWESRYPGLACALKRLSHTLLLATCVFEETVEEVSMRELVTSVGGVLPEGREEC